MASSFADFHSMPAQDFHLFTTGDEYADLHSYAPTATTAYMDPAFGVTLSTLDSYATIPAFQEMPRQQDFLSLENTKAQYGYSPNGSPAHSTSHSFDLVPPQLSTASESGASVQSTSSSAIGSPSLNPQYSQDEWNPMPNGLAIPGINFPQDSFTSGFEQEVILASDNKMPGCVDPNLINHFGSPAPFAPSAYPEIATPSPSFPSMPFEPQPPSPALSNTSASVHRSRQPGSHSPYAPSYQPYLQQQYPRNVRRPSASSIQSRHSHSSRQSSSYEIDDENREKGLCPIPECGKVFKDLKAHMLTHQTERPEKCPIQNCEYHTKGFARKYDKNRHTLTHYKGTMVCGFCPGSGSSAEKSFNRADVFKRHLTSVHGVEQTPPNSRKRSPTATKKGPVAPSTTTGTCSTCSVTFANVQDFYEHLDDCVLRVVQQADPAEAINQKNLTSMSDDKEVQETLDRHHLPAAVDYSAPSYDENDDEDDAEFDDDDENDESYGAKSNSRSGKGSIKSRRDSKLSH